MSHKIDRPYKALGELLETWRSSKYRSASAMFREITPSFAYKTYADFERGTHLPSVSYIIELSDLLGQNAEEALLLWAEVQMPNPKFKALFRRKAEPQQSAPVRQGSNAAAFSHPAFENTWVFGKMEHAFLLQEPWFFSFCQSLIRTFPNEVSYESLKLKSAKARKGFGDRFLKPWIEQGKIQVSETGIRISAPHIHLPKTELWDKIRTQNLEVALDSIHRNLTPEMITSKKAYREIVSRPLSAHQLVSCVSTMENVEKDFRDLIDDTTSKNNPMYSLVLILGPRTFEIPTHVLASCDE